MDRGMARHERASPALHRNARRLGRVSANILPYQVVALLVISCILSTLLPVPVWAAGSQASCTAGSLTFSSWNIPGTKGWPGWRPLAVDSNHIVMVKGPGDPAARPGPLSMALVTAGSARYHPLLPGAYPHGGVLQRWQLAWPWLVGLYSLQSPPTLGWTLWAGDLLTGKHLVLARGGPVRKVGTNRAVPDFDLSSGQVVWTAASYSPEQVTRLRSRIALFNLTNLRQTYLPIPPSSRRYGHPTLWGNRVVWERYTDFPCTRAHCPHELIDLQLYNLATHHLQTLSHSSFRTGNSFSPGLWRNDLVFLHGPQDAQGGGSVIMADLSHRVLGYHEHWWQNYRYRLLRRGPSIDLEVGDGLAQWDGGVADLATGSVARLPLGAEQWSGGRALIVHRIPPSGTAPYTLLRNSRPCST